MLTADTTRPSVPGGSIAGVILAGGRSSRMGTDKALLPIRGIPMIERVAETMRSVFADVCIVSNHGQSYSFLNLPSIPDIHHACGPLGGIHAALTSLENDLIFVLGCDTPFVSKELIQYIIEYVAGTPVRVAREGERIHPLCGVYARTCLPIASACITSGKLQMARFIEEAGCTFVPLGRDLAWYHDGLLYNINTPDDISTSRSTGIQASVVNRDG